ncbi:MAG TPA: vWA domain-containing protein [Candidatus Angelobacter sp.]|nr:vWA domain-containing protein [Candidatus Angelobacter sp.]
MRRVFWIALLFLPTLGAFAQQCTTYSVVEALDRKTGDDINNLRPEDFEASMGEHPLTVVSATQNFDNRVLVLLETDNMRSERVEDMVNLVTRLVRQAPEGRRLAFAVFSKRWKFAKTFNPNVKQRADEIRELVEEAPALGNGVALYDALHEAIKFFGPREPGDTVMLISDGFDDSSHRGASGVEKEVEKSGIRLLVMMRQPLSHVTGNFLWNPPEHDRAVLERMSVRTGGAYTMFGAQLFDFAWRGYLLGLQMPEGKTKPHSWKVKLGPLASELHRRHQLYYPQRLPGCDGVEEQSAAKINASQ